MSQIKFILFTFFIAVGLIACSGDAGQDQSTGEPAQTETEAGDNHEGHDHDGHDHDTKASGQVNTGFAVGHGEGTAYNSNYICPMHCEGSGSDSAGKCPVCGMDYVALKEHLKDGHNHNE